MTVQLTSAQEQRLEHLAEQTHRSPDELAQEAIELYLQHVELLTCEVREAEDEAGRNGWLTSEDVFRSIRNL